ncbi:hypothetical protein ABQE93_10510 [Mycolicibacterium sp. XJ662]
MAVVGADVDQLRTLARTLGQAADRLEGMTGSVTSMLGATTWFGPDAERHRSQWHSGSIPQVRGVVAALREAANTANRNADEQERASSAAGGIGAPAAGGGAPSPSPFGDGLPYRFDMVDPAVNIRDFLNTTPVWPITWGTMLGPLDDWGVLPLLDALGLAGDSSLTDGQRIIEAQNSLTDLAGGLLKSRGGVGYLGGVAVAQWGDVIAQVSQADFSAPTLQTTANYIATNPAGAFEAARDAVIGYVPKLFSNLVPW